MCYTNAVQNKGIEKFFVDFCCRFSVDHTGRKGGLSPMTQMNSSGKINSKQQSSVKKENPHAGHRNRLKDRFVNEGGLEHFELHNVLEILLFFGIPQKDTNEIAHELIRTFGGFPQVFLADVEQLAAVKGMTRNAAILIKLVSEVYRRFIDENKEKEEVLDTADKIRKYLIPKFAGRSEETVYLLCMNNACKLLRADIISKGNKSMAHVDLRKVAEIAFQCGAVSVILAHNHPHGIAKPSWNDENTTRRMQKVLSQLNIEFLDHFIVSGETAVSMMELGYLGVKNVVEMQILQRETLNDF